MMQTTRRMPEYAISCLPTLRSVERVDSLIMSPRVSQAMSIVACALARGHEGTASSEVKDRAEYRYDQIADHLEAAIAVRKRDRLLRSLLRDLRVPLPAHPALHSAPACRSAGRRRAESCIARSSPRAPAR